MAGGKKACRKAAASAAAHAASKHKTSSVAISADNEARVRDAIAVSICDHHIRQPHVSLNSLHRLLQLHSHGRMSLLLSAHELSRSSCSVQAYC